MKKFFLLFLPAIISVTVFAQNGNGDSLRKDALKVFIDCSYGCDMEFTRREITFVNYVIEPQDADVYVLITAMTTGSGGAEYTLFFSGQKKFASLSDTLTVFTNSSSTGDETRRTIVQKLKVGLMRFVAHTPIADDMDVTLRTGNTENVVEDKWKSWVFDISGSLYLSGAKYYQSLSASGTIRVSRITPDWKILMRLNGNYYEQNFEFSNSDEVISVYSRSYTFYNLLVRSLSDHWSAGYSLYALNSTYSNYDVSAWLMPAIEYDVFPYSQSSRRQLRLFYKIGPLYNDYTDTTIFNKTSELLFFQRFSASYEIIQKWGGISASLYASDFLHDFSKYNISLYSSMNIRIFKGLSFNLYGQYALIHDQLSLPKAGASDEEILLRQRELATQYSYYLSAGLSYTFGSIYNNVVNPRFGD